MSDLKGTTPPSSEAGSDNRKGMWTPDPVESKRGVGKLRLR
jgi:hypothetical protein